LEEEADVAEALRQDLCDELLGDAMAAVDDGTDAEGESDEEEEAAERLAAPPPPPPYAGEIAKAFEVLEAQLTVADNREALAALRTAKMAVLTAYAQAKRPKTHCQTVIRDYFRPQAAGGAASS
jgi:hypothetical protein